MTFPSQQQIDIIATQILFDAKQAILSLKAWNNSITDGATKMRLFKELIKSTATQMNGDIGRATSAVSKFAGAMNVNSAAINHVGKELKNADSGFLKLASSVHTARIALGAIISMLLFQGIQAITGFFKSAIDQARQFEATLYRIRNAERQLSMEGIEISVKGLKKGIEDIQKALPIFSKEDVAQLIGGVAVSTKELGLNEEQVLKLSAAYAILNINSTETETLLQTAAKANNALISPQAKSIGNLGLSFGKAKMEAKAFEMGLLEIGQTFADLTEKQKTQIKYQIILETANIDNINSLEELRDKIKEAGGDYQALNDYLESNDAKLSQNSAAWMDLKTTVGQVILPFIPALTFFFELINNGFNAGKVLIIEFITAIATLGVTMAAVFSGKITSLKQFADFTANAITTFREELTNQFFKGVPENAPDWFMKGWGGLIKEDAETATGALEGMYDAAAEDEEAQKALEDLDQKIQEIILDAKQAQEDLDLRLEQKQADLDTEYGRKAEDAARIHSEKLADIETDARQKAEDARAKSREEEKKAEDDLLQKLKELRQRFLLDLEDALHARDARQVLRLIKEYKLEKQNLLDRKKLDDQQRKDKLAEDLRAIEIERQRRVEAENIDYKRRLADLALNKAREQAELQLWYKREQEDIQRNIQQKLEKLLAGYITEGKIHETEQAKIHAILLKYFGKNTQLVDSLANFMATRFAQISALAAQSAQTAIPVGQYGQTTASPYFQSEKGVAPRPTSAPVRHGGEQFAEGGSFLATRPTTAMFGERGPELATFTPLNRSGRDVGKLFGNASGGGMSGEIYVNVDLSPDLEARVIQRSMNGVGQVVSKVNRRKL